MLRDIQARHRRLMAELSALEAQEHGIDAARIVAAPREKASIGKVVAALGGIGAVVWFLVFKKDGPLSSVIEEKTKEQDRSKQILNTIRFGAMDDEPEAQPKPKFLSGENR